MKRLVLITLLMPALMLAQSNRGSIAGTVTDASGAVIPSATVTIVNEGTGASLTLTTSHEGAYVATALDPVFYRVTVEFAGFQKAVLEHVKVDTASAKTLNVALQPGGVATSMVVQDTTPLVNAESAVTGTVIEQKQIVDMPLNNRSVLDLALTAPNVIGEVGTEDPAVTTATQNPGVGLIVNGGRAGSSTILADGVNNTATGISRTVVSFSPDVVQEFSIMTSSYSAEFGQTGGGVINATTRSGTNSFRGTVYWYNRNPKFNATPFTTAVSNRPVDNLRQNQFGLILSGPVMFPKPHYSGRNRTFFFFAWEPRRFSNGSTVDELLPEAAMRGGDFSNAVNVAGGVTTRDMAQRYGVPITGDAIIYNQYNPVGNKLQQKTLATGQLYGAFPNNQIPKEYLDPVSVSALKYMLKPGDYFVNDAGQLRNWSGSRFVKNSEQRTTTRFDHQITDTNKVNVRWTRVPILGVRGTGTFNNTDQVNALGSDYSASNQILLGDTYIFSPRMINDLRLNYTRGNYSRVDPPEFLTRNLSTELGLPSITKGGLPFFNIGGLDWGRIGQRQQSTLQQNIENGYNIADSLSRTQGNKTWKFGADLRKQQMKAMPYTGATGGNYFFNARQTNENGQSSGATGGIGMASYLLGVPNSITLVDSLIPYYYEFNSASFFAQNDWKVRPNLTLNLGLRYSLQLPRTEKYNHQGVFLPDKAASVALTDAQRQAFATAVGLPLASAPTSVLVPAFGYSGYGGRSQYMTPIDWNGWEPRFGFAWSPAFNFNRERRFVVRGGYGISHAAVTGLGRDPIPRFGAPSSTYTFNSGQVDPNYVTRLSSNPPNVIAKSPDQILQIPSDGIVTLGSINIPGFIVDPGFRVPYVQNWSLSLNYQLSRTMAVEAAYVGNKGTHLFMPPINTNAVPFSASESLIGAGLDPGTNVTDPLGRRNLNGGAISVPRGSLLTRYPGFDMIDLRLDPSANSIRHAGYVNVQRRFTNRLGFTANYTFAKSIDDASDSGRTDPGELQSIDARSQVNFGGTRRAERSVSTFDVRHSFASTFAYEFPFGKGGRFATHLPAPLETMVGGWRLTGTSRIVGGLPFVPLLTDNNRLGGSRTGVRPDLVLGVPVLNPLYDRNCPIGSLCEPYFNPAAFMRPPKGELGNAPRSLDGFRTPRREYLDLSLQKQFKVFGGRDTSRYLQLRADFINVLNHPNFLTGNSGGNQAQNIFSLPSESTLTAAEYNAWASANNRPRTDNPAVSAQATALMNQINAQITSARVGTSTVLRPDFFSIPVPQGFATKNVNSFDITTLQGLKLYRLKQAYNPTFGTLGSYTNSTQARIIQFSLKLYF